MINRHINEYLARAGDKLYIAENELLRPSEDSVTFTVCHTSNGAIREYLVSLIAYNYTLEFPGEDMVIDTLKKIENWNIEFLKDYATMLDPRFAILDFTPLNCSGLEKEDSSEKYCLSVDTVRKCAVIAREVEKLVTEYINTIQQPRDNSQIHRVFRSFLN